MSNGLGKVESVVANLLKTQQKKVTAEQQVDVVCSECQMRLVALDSDAPACQSGARYWCKSCSIYFDAGFKGMETGEVIRQANGGKIPTPWLSVPSLENAPQRQKPRKLIAVRSKVANAKYLRRIKEYKDDELRITVDVDVYDVINGWRVSDPGLQHAIKKILQPGSRGSKGYVQDLREAIQAIERAIENAPEPEPDDADE